MAAISLVHLILKYSRQGKVLILRMHRSIKLFQGLIDLYVLFTGNKRGRIVLL